MPEFLLNALLAGIGLALVAGPVGSFVIWRRMAYFGDTLAHSGLLGVAIGVLAGIGMRAAVIGTAVAIALLVMALRRRRRLADDTLLGILAHSALAVGLIALALGDGVRVDLDALLFGDVLAVTRGDLLWIWGGGVFVLASLAVLWRPLIALTLNEDLARVSGVRATPVLAAFMLLVAVVIAIAMQIVGILLITALLIIPPAAARRFAHTPERMAVLGALFGVLAIVLGLAAAWWRDLPAGPAMVAVASLLFLATMLVPGDGETR